MQDTLSPGCASSCADSFPCCAMFCCCVWHCPCAVRGGLSKPVPRQVTADGVLYGKRVKDLSQLANDDELAAEEAAAQGGIPGEQAHVHTLIFIPLAVHAHGLYLPTYAPACCLAGMPRSCALRRGLYANSYVCAVCCAGYCADRLLRAYAGGQYCSKFDQ